MKSLVLALTLLLIACPAAAGETDLEVVQETIQAALNARGTDAYEDAKAALYATVLDPDTKPACRRYADTMFAGLVLMDAPYRESPMLLSIFSQLLDYAPTAKNDCLLAI